MDLLMNVLKPNLLTRLKEVTSLVKISNRSDLYNYELLNTALKCGYTDVADFLLDRNCKVNKPSQSVENTPLHYVVKWNDIPLVKKLLEKQASITAIDVQNNTPLHLAFLLGHTEIVDVIIEHLMATSNYTNTKNIDGLTQFHIASARGNTLAVQKFIDDRASVRDVVSGAFSVYRNYNALKFACDIKSLETIKVIAKARPLVENYNEEHFKNTIANTSFQDSLKSVIIRLHHVPLEPHQPTSERLIDFHLACLILSVHTVKECVNEGSFVNFRTGANMKFCPLYTALHFSIEGNISTYEKVKLLLKYGANVELQSGYCMTPVHLAFYYSDFRSINHTVKLLYNALKHKDANLMDVNGLTYFHIAIAMNDFKIVENLLNNMGIDVNQAILPNLRNFSNYTPLHFAVKYRHLEMAKLLIKHGAEVNPIGCMTPLQLACEAGHVGLIDLLTKQGAVVDIVCPDTGKTLLHLFIDNIVDCKENLYYLRRKNFRNHHSRPEEVRYWIRRLVGLIDVDAKDRKGNTVLHTICSKLFSRSRYAKDLLWYGADINIENENGETSFELTCSSKLRPSYDEFLVLYYHVQKLKALGYQINAKNDRCCELLMIKKHEWYVLCEKIDEQELKKNKLEVEQEIKKLKSVYIDENVSLFDFLTMDFEQAVYFTFKVKKLIDTVDLKTVFYLYGYLPYVQYNKGIKWFRNQHNARKRARETQTHLTLSVKMNIIKRLKYH